MSVGGSIFSYLKKSLKVDRYTIPRAFGETTDLETELYSAARGLFGLSPSARESDRVSAVQKTLSLVGDDDEKVTQILDFAAIAAGNRDSDLVEVAMVVACTLKFSKKHINQLSKLLHMPHHREHENIVFSLSKFDDPSLLKEYLYVLMEVVPDKADQGSIDVDALKSKAVYGIANLAPEVAIPNLEKLSSSSQDEFTCKLSAELLSRAN